MEIVETTEAGSALLDAVIKKLNLKHDAALSRRLSVNPAVISKIRNGRADVRAYLVIRMHEETGLSIKELRSYLPANYRLM
jgi:plasmid maintenance system antidote protein VapI